MTPGLQERVLGRLLDVAAVGEQPPEQGHDPGLLAAHELRERSRVPGAGRGEQWVRAARIGSAVDGIEGHVHPFSMLRDGTCVGTRRRLSGLLDGDLDGSTAARLRRHLRHCRRCGRVERSLRRVVGELHELAPGPPSVTVDPSFDGISNLVHDPGDHGASSR